MSTCSIDEWRIQGCYHGGPDMPHKNGRQAGHQRGHRQSEMNGEVPESF